jgi:FkbM family methyltransferase
MIYHSQPATEQDRWVIADSDELRNGYFVEIGAFDGLRHSNTLTLERELGWKGMLVEANPDLFDLVRVNRPNCHLRNVAVGPKTLTERARFTANGEWGGLRSFMPDAWRDEADRREAETKWVRVESLRDILAEAPKHIDYLSLDIEGAEIVVLQSYAPRLNTDHTIDRITVEYREETETLAKLRWILEPEYELVRVQAWDAFFKRRGI